MVRDVDPSAFTIRVAAGGEFGVHDRSVRWRSSVLTNADGTVEVKPGIEFRLASTVLSVSATVTIAGDEIQSEAVTCTIRGDVDRTYRPVSR